MKVTRKKRKVTLIRKQLKEIINKMNEIVKKVNDANQSNIEIHKKAKKKSKEK